MGQFFLRKKKSLMKIGHCSIQKDSNNNSIVIDFVSKNNMYLVATVVLAPLILKIK